MFLDSRQSQPRDNQQQTTDVAESGPADGTVTVVDAVRSQLAAVLGIKQSGELNLEGSLFDLGVDSMLAVELRNRLKRLIGRTVSLATLLGEITGDQLVEKLEGADERSGTAQKVDISRD
jgi:mycobactin polyketide synthetase MbtD